MTTPDSPSSPGPLLAAIPTFRAPATDPLPTDATVTPPAHPMPVSRETSANRPRLGLLHRGDRGEPSGPNRTDGTPTGTSATAGKPDKAPNDPRVVAEILTGLLGLVAGAGAALVTWRSRSTRRLREPTADELADVARPAGRILTRHVDSAALTPDLADGVRALAALGRYLTREPLITRRYPDAGIPADLQETPA